MKTVIITRDGEYGNSYAYKKISEVSKTNGKGHFNAYIHSLFKRYLTNEEPQEYADIIGRSSLPSEEEIRIALGKDEEGIGESIYEQEVKGKLDQILSSCKPYASFKMDNGNEVTFVFINEVFDKFFPSSYDDYPRFVKCENRKEFIEAICQDCNIQKTSNNNNMLYIHDKEWGRSGEKYIIVNNLIFDSEGENALNDYGEYFSNLIVFQHAGLIFNQIKALKFEIAKEVCEELRIKTEGYF